MITITLAAAGLSAAQQPVSAHTATTLRPVPREVARVNGVAIKEDRLALAVNALMPMESFHRNVSADKMAALRQKAIDRLIDEELRYQDGVRRGIRVTPADVDGRIAELTAQYGGAQKLALAEQKSGVTVPQLRREITRALTIQQAFARTVTAQCQVTRDEAAKFFHDNPSRFVQPEQLHIFAITIGVDPSSTAARWAEAKSRAEDVLNRIQKGAKFEDLARTYSTDPSKKTGGDMGYFHRGTLNDDFEKAASQLKVGQSSEVIKTLYGFHIVRLGDIRAPRARTFAEVSAELRKDLTTRRCTEMETAWAAKLRAGATVDVTGLSAK